MRYGFKLKVCGVIASALIGFWGLPATAAEPSGGGTVEVPWKELTFGASKWLNRVTTRIETSIVDGASATAGALTSDQGQPLEASGPRLRLIDVHTTIDPTIGATVELTETFWIDPARGNVLFGKSLRTGQDEYLRRFRFTRQGVFRFRREPSSRQEAHLPPLRWSDTKASFYAYDPQKWDCRQVLVPSTLIYLINEVILSSPEQSPTFCVFHKRQLYRVTLKHGGTRLVDIDYPARTDQRFVDIQKRIPAARLLLKAVPLGDYGGETEDFSFLGFKKNVELFFDPSTRLPVMISGHVPTLGQSVLSLKAVQLLP